MWPGKISTKFSPTSFTIRSSNKRRRPRTVMATYSFTTRRRSSTVTMFTWNSRRELTRRLRRGRRKLGTRRSSVGGATTWSSNGASKPIGSQCRSTLPGRVGSQSSTPPWREILSMFPALAAPFTNSTSQTARLLPNTILSTQASRTACS